MTNSIGFKEVFGRDGKPITIELTDEFLSGFPEEFLTARNMTPAEFKAMLLKAAKEANEEKHYDPQEAMGAFLRKAGMVGVEYGKKGDKRYVSVSLES
jgi:hypothetical protein